LKIKITSATKPTGLQTALYYGIEENGILDNIPRIYAEALKRELQKH